MGGTKRLTETLAHSTRSSTISDDHCRNVRRSMLTGHTNEHQHSVPISTISEIDHREVRRSRPVRHTNAHQHSGPISTISEIDPRDVGRSRSTGHTNATATTDPDHHPYAPPSEGRVSLQSGGQPYGHASPDCWLIHPQKGR